MPRAAIRSVPPTGAPSGDRRGTSARLAGSVSLPSRDESWRENPASGRGVLKSLRDYTKPVRGGMPDSPRPFTVEHQCAGWGEVHRSDSAVFCPRDAANGRPLRRCCVPIAEPRLQARLSTVVARYSHARPAFGQRRAEQRHVPRQGHRRPRAFVTLEPSRARSPRKSIRQNQTRRVEYCCMRPCRPRSLSAESSQNLETPGANHSEGLTVRDLVWWVCTEDHSVRRQEGAPGRAKASNGRYRHLPSTSVAPRLRGAPGSQSAAGAR